MDLPVDETLDKTNYETKSQSEIIENVKLGFQESVRNQIVEMLNKKHNDELSQLVGIVEEVKSDIGACNINDIIARFLLDNSINDIEFETDSSLSSSLCSESDAAVLRGKLGLITGSLQMSLKKNELLEQKVAELSARCTDLENDNLCLQAEKEKTENQMVINEQFREPMNQVSTLPALPSFDSIELLLRVEKAERRVLEMESYSNLYIENIQASECFWQQMYYNLLHKVHGSDSESYSLDDQNEILSVARENQEEIKSWLLQKAKSGAADGVPDIAQTAALLADYVSASKMEETTKNFKDDLLNRSRTDQNMERKLTVTTTGSRKRARTEVPMPRIEKETSLQISAEDALAAVLSRIHNSETNICDSQLRTALDSARLVDLEWHVVALTAAVLRLEADKEKLINALSASNNPFLFTNIGSCNSLAMNSTCNINLTTNIENISVSTPIQPASIVSQIRIDSSGGSDSEKLFALSGLSGEGFQMEVLRSCCRMYYNRCIALTRILSQMQMQPQHDDSEIKSTLKDIEIKYLRGVIEVQRTEINRLMKQTLSSLLETLVLGITSTTSICASLSSEFLTNSRVTEIHEYCMETIKKGITRVICTNNNEYSQEMHRWRESLIEAIKGNIKNRYSPGDYLIGCKGLSDVHAISTLIQLLTAADKCVFTLARDSGCISPPTQTLSAEEIENMLLNSESKRRESEFNAAIAGLLTLEPPGDHSASLPLDLVQCKDMCLCAVKECIEGLNAAKTFYEQKREWIFTYLKEHAQLQFIASSDNNDSPRLVYECLNDLEEAQQRAAEKETEIKKILLDAKNAEEQVLEYKRRTSSLTKTQEMMQQTTQKQDMLIQDMRKLISAKNTIISSKEDQLRNLENELTGLREKNEELKKLKEIHETYIDESCGVKDEIDAESYTGEQNAEQPQEDEQAQGESAEEEMAHEDSDYHAEHLEEEQIEDADVDKEKNENSEDANSVQQVSFGKNPW